MKRESLTKRNPDADERVPAGSTAKLQGWVQESPERARECARESLIIDVSEEILAALEAEGLSKAELAELFGASKSHITQLLSGERNMTLRSLADMGFALKRKPCFRLLKENQHVACVAEGDAVLRRRRCVSVVMDDACNEPDWRQALQAADVAATDSVLTRLQQTIVLQDVYVREVTAAVLGAFDPKATDAPDFGIQLRFSVESARLEKSCRGEQDAGLVRYLIATGLRFVVADAGDSDAAPTALAEITAVFVADYEARDASAVTEQALQAFNEHALHHVWPFWREFIHMTSGRLRLPSVILPGKIRQP